jgi:hypothetical protein
MSQAFFNQLPAGFVPAAKSGRLVPSHPTAGELFEMMFAAAVGKLYLVPTPPEPGWHYEGEHIDADTLYVELSRRGWETAPRVARDVFYRVARAVEDEPAAARLERALAATP